MNYLEAIENRQIAIEEGAKLVFVDRLKEKVHGAIAECQSEQVSSFGEWFLEILDEETFKS